MIKERSLIGLAVIAVLAACGGGGGGSTTPTPSQQIPAGYARAQFAITVPSGSGSSSTNRRSPKFVASGTQSISLALLQTNGTPVTSTPQLFPLTATSPGCSSGTSGITCTFSLNAPIGTDVYLATTYSDVAGTQQLGSGAVALSVVQNTTNTASISLNGPVNSIVTFSNNLQFNDTLWNGVGSYVYYAWEYNPLIDDSVARRPETIASSSPSGAPSTEQLYLIAFDSAGNTILNPATYNQPIILTLHLYNPSVQNVLLSDLSGSTTTSTSVDTGTVSIVSPADKVTLSIIPGIPSPQFYYFYANFGYVQASLASPPAGFASSPYPFAVEAVPTPSPSPSPSPTPVPTITPSPAPTGNLTVIGQ
jgi:hypothetical protein